MRGGLNLSADQAVEGARVAAANAHALLDFAVAGSKSGRFGPSIAMCVLASEEGAKALALFFNAISPEDGVLLRETFSRHKTKHDLSGLASLMIHLSGIMFRVKEEVQAELDRGIDSGQRPGSWT
jgi:AbiV family abortive infection protein